MPRAFAPSQVIDRPPVVLTAFRELTPEDVAESTEGFAEIAEQPFGPWALDVPEPSVGALNMERFPFQPELYSEEVANAREVVVMKATQVGVSAWGLRQALYASDVWGDTALYIFPTKEHVTEFADERVDPIIDNSPYLRSRIPRGHVKTKSQKRIGRGWLYFRGSESRSGAQSIPASFIMFDEYDDLNQKNLPQLERRLSGAEAKGRSPRLRRVGVPRFPGGGISKAYEASDRRVWMTECAECGHDQEMDFWKNVRWRTRKGKKAIMRGGQEGKDIYADTKDVTEAWRVCAECEAKIDVRKGRWVKQNPGSPIPGFHIPRLIVPYTDLAEVVRNSRQTKPDEIEAFFNNDLGIPYASSESSLDEATIEAASSYGQAMVQSYSGPNPVTMGVDVASERDLNVRISEQLPTGQRRALWVGRASKFKEISNKMRAYNVTFCVIDGEPERRMARTVAAEFPGRVSICAYTSIIGADALAYNPDKNLVTVHRTQALDAVMQAIREVRSIPPKPMPEDYVENLMALHRRIEEDAKGRQIAVYHSIGADDYAHAEVYDLVATQMWHMRVRVEAQATEEIEEVPDEEMGFDRIQLDGGDDGYYGGMGGY